MRVKLAILIISCLALCCCRSVAAPRAFSEYVLEAVRAMPAGGGYAADRVAEQRLAAGGIVWDGRQLRVSPRGAAPTFCSAACYMALLQALRSWEGAQGSSVFSPRVWESMRVDETHPDGYLSWGRANANGPGFAKWVSDLGAGVNFTAVAKARPGDFLKFFRTDEIGVAERGHMVIFLGLEQRGGSTYIRYWSANKGQGYGERSVPLSSLRYLIFTRITQPGAFARAPQLPPMDPWLHSMLTHPHRFEQVKIQCRISE